MLIKIIKTYRNVIAICDKELLGKKFEENKFQLDVKDNFFNGDETTPEEAIEIMKRMSLEDSTFNIIGKKSTDTAIEAGIITENQIKRIQDIPFALVLV
jgi:hypothetical protein|tara:strand:- start:398 stop:694 length:297 start_codon:yes stop_codon:yes gene_type:complete